MKKTLLLLSFCAGLAACSSAPDQSATTDKPAKAAHDDLPVNAPTAAQAPADDKPADALNRDSVKNATVAAVDEQPQVNTNATTMTGTTPTGTPDAAGAKLMAAADCASCHREKEKLLGPAYTAIAAKYPATPANVTMLAKKIIKGGMGHWGDIAMTPHPGLSESNAKQMVDYILTLK